MIFPGLLNYYGPNHTMDIQFAISKVENFRSRKNSDTVKFDADLFMKFWVNDVNGT